MKKKTSLRLDIVRISGNWHVRKKLDARLRPALRHIVEQTRKLRPGRYTITLVLTDDAHQKNLNHDFRGLNKSTNVLSFPQYLPTQIKRIKPKVEPVFLGEITLAHQYIAKEAKKNNIILINHIIHLAIHGILHILGYDHATLKQAAVMERLEQKILDAMDIPDPYAPVLPKRQSRSRRTR